MLLSTLSQQRCRFRPSLSTIAGQKLAWFAIFFVTLSSFLVETNACSCILRYKTFQETFDEADHLNAVFIFGQVRVNYRGEFAGFVTPGEDDDINEDIYFLAYNWKSYKGCSAEQRYEIYVTAGNSALCGVNPTPGRWYVVESSFNSNNGFKELQLCEFSTLWEDFTYDQYWYAEDNKQQCRYPYGHYY